MLHGHDPIVGALSDERGCGDGLQGGGFADTRNVLFDIDRDFQQMAPLDDPATAANCAPAPANAGSRTVTSSCSWAP